MNKILIYLFWVEFCKDSKAFNDFNIENKIIKTF